MKEQIKNTLQESQQALDALINNDTELGNIDSAAQLIIESLTNGGTIFSCGNGGSMCDAMHFAEELTGRYRQNRRGHAAVAISDPSHISCVANDFGYEFIFSRYLESHAKAGDVLIGISTSGTSKNVVEAAKAAQKLGVKAVILSGRAASELESLADVYVCTKGGDYADRVQELHIKTLHIFIELVERHFHPENYDD